jgi:hypothetical protein
MTISASLVLIPMALSILLLELVGCYRDMDHHMLMRQSLAIQPDGKRSCSVSLAIMRYSDFDARSELWIYSFGTVK